MKHNSEDISRLDGDIYELSTGGYIDFTHVVSVGPLDMNNGLSYEYLILLSSNCSIIINIEGEGCIAGKVLYKEAEKRHQQFINIWKEWKRRNKEQCKCQEQIR